MSRDEMNVVEELKKKRKAVILAHSYQPPEIQDIADFVGDSLELSRKAAETPAEVIIFCGVRFMAETAHILAPEKTVILPEPDAGCPLADCIDVESLRGMQALHPDALTVLYVNSPAAAKAESYTCCTSANAVKVVESVPSREVIFAPDRNLGLFVSGRTTKKIHIWEGSCRCHDGVNPDELATAREKWPGARLLVHPETPPEAWNLADAVLGTGGMIRYVESSDADMFLIGTEEGMVYRLRTLFPDRRFLSVGSIRCEDMKKTTPEKVLRSLRTLEPAVTLDPVIREKAFRAVSRMTEVSS